MAQHGQAPLGLTVELSFGHMASLSRTPCVNDVRQF
jgi:hypothetical protein